MLVAVNLQLQDNFIQAKLIKTDFLKYQPSTEEQWSFSKDESVVIVILQKVSKYNGLWDNNSIWELES